MMAVISEYILYGEDISDQRLQKISGDENDNTENKAIDGFCRYCNEEPVATEWVEFCNMCWFLWDAGEPFMY